MDSLRFFIVQIYLYSEISNIKAQLLNINLTFAKKPLFSRFFQLRINNLLTIINIYLQYIHTYRFF